MSTHTRSTGLETIEYSSNDIDVLIHDLASQMTAIGIEGHSIPLPVARAFIAQRVVYIDPSYVFMLSKRQQLR